MKPPKRFVQAVRGATQLTHDRKSEMCQKVSELIQQLLKKNTIAPADIISIIFSQTDDLKSANPATELRVDDRFEQTVLFCAQEPQYAHALPRIVRVLLHYRSHRKNSPQAVYLHGAQGLRNDYRHTEPKNSQSYRERVRERNSEY